MVERLKAAIEKARSQRAMAEAGREGRLTSTAGTSTRTIAEPSFEDTLFASLPVLELDDAHLTANRIVTANRADPAYIAFDMLRSRLHRVCIERGWRRLAITSPTKGCGKSLVSANLAISIARQPEARPMILDFDLRFPTQLKRFGFSEERNLQSLLNGELDLASYLLRINSNLVILGNTTPIRNSAEVIASQRMTEFLQTLQKAVRPTTMIFDLAPLLVSDDVHGFLPSVDAVVLVAGAGQTTAREISDCERLIGDVPFLGVVLNRDEVDAPETYLEQYA